MVLMMLFDASCNELLGELFALYMRSEITSKNALLVTVLKELKF